MRQGLPARWPALVGSVNRWETVVQYSNDGGREWIDCTFEAGSVTASATSQARWSCDLDLSGVHVGRGGLNAFTSRLRVLHGLPGIRPIPMGVYRIDEPQQTHSTKTRVHVSGESFESYFISPDGDFEVPRSFGPTTAEALVDRLIKEILPRATIVWRGGLNSGQPLPQLTGATSPWELIDGSSQDPSVAKAVGGIVYCGGAGEWIVGPPGSLSDQVVWEVNEGGVLVDSTVSQSRDGVYDRVIVTGEPPGRLPVGPIIVRDEDPTSLTYYLRSPDDGGFGRKPFKYSAPTILNTAQGYRAAQSMLAQRLGLRQQVSFTSLHNPALEPGDVIMVDTPQGKLRMIIDSLTFDLSGAPTMQATTRTTSTLLTGLSYAFAEDEVSA